MPLVRYEIRSEYELANRELYRTAPKNDPQAMLEGVAMVSLVGIVRQLGDLAEFAADVFHDLHEALMATASRSHDLVARVSQLEGELPAVEKAIFSKETNHVQFAYAQGLDWHASVPTDQNLCTQGDLPRFIRSSYEECRGPPRLFLLDKFDVQGVGACLKRYTDPSFFKMEWASSELMKAEKAQQQKKARRGKKAKGRKDGEVKGPKPAIHFQPRVRHPSLSTSSVDGHSENTTPLSAMAVEIEQANKLFFFSNFVEESSRQSSSKESSITAKSPKSVRRFGAPRPLPPFTLSPREPRLHKPQEQDPTSKARGEEAPRGSTGSEVDQYLDAMTTMESETDSEPRERRRFFDDLKSTRTADRKSGYETEVFFEDARNSAIESETESKYSAELTPIPVDPQLEFVDEAADQDIQVLERELEGDRVEDKVTRGDSQGVKSTEEAAELRDIGLNADSDEDDDLPELEESTPAHVIQPNKSVQDDDRPEQPELVDEREQIMQDSTRCEGETDPEQDRTPEDGSTEVHKMVDGGSDADEDEQFDVEVIQVIDAAPADAKEILEDRVLQDLNPDYAPAYHSVHMGTEVGVSTIDGDEQKEAMDFDQATLDADQATLDADQATLDADQPILDAHQLTNEEAQCSSQEMAFGGISQAEVRDRDRDAAQRVLGDDLDREARQKDADAEAIAASEPRPESDASSSREGDQNRLGSAEKYFSLDSHFEPGDINSEAFGGGPTLDSVISSREELTNEEPSSQLTSFNQVERQEEDQVEKPEDNVQDVYEDASSEDVFMDPDYQSSSRFSDAALSDFDFRDGSSDNLDQFHLDADPDQPAYQNDSLIDTSAGREFSGDHHYDGDAENPDVVIEQQLEIGIPSVTDRTSSATIKDVASKEESPASSTSSPLAFHCPEVAAEGEGVVSLKLEPLSPRGSSQGSSLASSPRSPIFSALRAPMSPVQGKHSREVFEPGSPISALQLMSYPPEPEELPPLPPLPPRRWITASSPKSSRGLPFPRVASEEPPVSTLIPEAESSTLRLGETPLEQEQEMPASKLSRLAMPASEQEDASLQVPANREQVEWKAELHREPAESENHGQVDLKAGMPSETLPGDDHVELNMALPPEMEALTASTTERIPGTAAGIQGPSMEAVTEQAKELEISEATKHATKSEASEAPGEQDFELESYRPQIGPVGTDTKTEVFSAKSDLQITANDSEKLQIEPTSPQLPDAARELPPSEVVQEPLMQDVRENASREVDPAAPCDLDSPSPLLPKSEDKESVYPEPVDAPETIIPTTIETTKVSTEPARVSVAPKAIETASESIIPTMETAEPEVAIPTDAYDPIIPQSTATAEPVSLGVVIPTDAPEPVIPATEAAEPVSLEAVIPTDAQEAISPETDAPEPVIPPTEPVIPPTEAAGTISPETDAPEAVIPPTEAAELIPPQTDAWEPVIPPRETAELVSPEVQTDAVSLPPTETAEPVSPEVQTDAVSLPPTETAESVPLVVGSAGKLDAIPTTVKPEPPQVKRESAEAPPKLVMFPGPELVMFPNLSGTVQPLPVSTIPDPQPETTIPSKKDPVDDALIKAISQHDRSKLKKVASDLRPPPSKGPDERDVLLEQIRSQSFNLRRHTAAEKKEKRESPKPQIMSNINVAAILEKANAIRQAFAGSDDDEDDDWSD